MTLDKKSVDMILRLKDEQLVSVIRKLATGVGIDANNINPSPEQISSIRQALSTATDSDLKRAGEIIREFNNSKKS